MFDHLKHGDKVFFVPNRYSSEKPRHVTVDKVGTRWVHVLSGYSGMRFDLKTGEVDGGVYSSPGQIWLTEQEYLDECALDRRWYAVAKFFDNHLYQRPESITPEKLSQIEEILKE